MRAALDKTVQGLRSQKMTFSNDGIELSLSVPDSEDVKSAFGTMVNTVVEQNDELGKLNTHIEKVETANKTARKKMVDATSQKLQQLMEHQMRLESQLQAAQNEIKNFAYNIQGYVDDTETSPPVTSSTVQIVKDIAIDPAEFDEDNGQSTLYPTEHGAPVESLGFKTVPDTVRPKRKQKDLSAVIYYKGIPKVAFPPDARGRWRWAYKKVMLSIRVKKNKISLSRTRVEKSQTLIERIDKMDRELFSLPDVIENKLKASMEVLLGAVGTQMKEIQNQVTELDEKAKERESAVFNKFQTLETQLQGLDKKVAASLAALEEKQTKIESSLMGSINELRNQVKDAVALDLDRLRVGLQDVTDQLGGLDKVVHTSLTDLQGLVLEDATIQQLEPQDALDRVVENNASIQLFRSTVAVTEASCDILQRSINSLKRDVGAAFHHYGQKFLGSHTIVSRDDTSRLEETLMRSKAADGFMKVVRDTLGTMKALLKRHDRNLSMLSQRVNGQAMEATKAFPDMQESIEILQAHARSTGDGLKSAQSELLRLTNVVGQLEADSGQLMQKHSEQQALGGTDTTKDIATLKIQMDAIRTLLFDKSRPGSSNVGEAAVAAAMAAAGTSAIAPQPMPNEGFGDLIPTDLRALQFSDDDSQFPGASRPLSGFPAQAGQLPVGASLSQQYLTATVADILRQLLPDLVPDLSQYPTLAQSSHTSGAALAGSGAQGWSDPQASSDAPNGGVAEAEGGDLEQESPSQIARKRMDARRLRVDKSPEELAAMGPDAYGSASAQHEPGSPSISAAIRQVQQVFGDGTKPATAPPGLGLPISKALRNKIGSVDLSHGASNVASVHSTPKSGRNRALGGLRGSFESLGGGSFVGGHGSFMMGPNDFGYAGGSAPAFDATPLFNDIAALRTDLVNTRRKLEIMDEEKITKAVVEKACHDTMTEMRRKDARTDYRSMIEDADKSIRELVKEVILLRHNQESTAQLMREEMSKALEGTVQSAVQSVSDSFKESVVSTKALCLGCGRQSAVRTEPGRPASPPFFPHLSAGSLPGPDVLRGGFKMPVRAASPPPPNFAALQALAPSEREIPILLRGRVQYDSKSGKADLTGSDLLPEVSQLTTPGTTAGAPDGNVLAGSDLTQLPLHRDPADQARPMSGGGMGHGVEALRPIFRKGFPARKSAKAEMNFAPERFELVSMTMPGRPQSRSTNLRMPLVSQSLTSFAPPPN